MIETVFARIYSLSKCYGRLRALDSVSFDVECGEVLGVLGPNGSGKTTLLECLAGLLPADAGEVNFVRAAPGARRHDQLFYLPDGIAPWPDQPTAWVLRFAAGLFGCGRQLQADLISRLALEGSLQTPLGRLSKGQRKRALLALALATPQPMLVIDEPFDGLDLRQTRTAAALLREAAAHGRAVVVAIHQIADAGAWCDRFVLLNGGKVCAQGTRAELETLAASGGRGPNLAFEEVFLALT